jgi:itaconate CoA-transferase
LIEGAFAGSPAADVIRRLDTAQIASARMNTMREFVAHPQLSARSRWREIESPVGPIPALLPPTDLEGATAVMGAVPDLGQHSESILLELGFTREDIDRWRAAGAI